MLFRDGTESIARERAPTGCDALTSTCGLVSILGRTVSGSARKVVLAYCRRCWAPGVMVRIADVAVRDERVVATNEAPRVSRDAARS